MLGRGFIIFWIFFLFFPEYSCPGRIWTEFWSKILYSLFRPMGVLAKNNARKRFYNFFNFFTIFFRNFISWVEYERNFGVKFRFHFFGLSLPVLAKNNAGKRFYNFLNFFTIFFRNFLSWVEYERNFGVKFCFNFFGLSPPRFS